jgi:tRNA (cytidine/uridine-2'-O-)-methyltransferase
LHNLNIVLVEPEIPQNTGNIARTCAATGAKLHIVRPMGFQIDDKKLKRAGLDYWWLLDITYYDHLDAFLEAHKDDRLFYYTTKAPRAHTEICYPKDVYFLFGKETKGLPESLLSAHYEDCVRIPMISDARSLNLSNSVAIAAYEYLRQMNYEGLLREGKLHGKD